MTVQQAIDELLEIAGLDLDSTNARRLLYEANVQLCVRSRWTRATVSIGPTVADQAAYALTDEIAEPLEVYVDGVPYDNADERTVAQINSGDLSLRSQGLWWVSFDSAGVESISLFPTPSDAALTVNVLAVVVPANPDLDAQFTPPADFHRANLEYVQGVSLGASEDDVDRRAVHWQEFERQVSRLHARRLTRSAGRGGAQLRVVGWTA